MYYINRRKIMFRSLIVIWLCFLAACGYSTRGFIYKERRIVISPLLNRIDIASTGRRTSGYANFPVLIENRLTSRIINKFNIDGGLKVVNQAQGALELGGEVLSYEKQALRYTDNDDIKEQRLRLTVHVKITDSLGEILQDKNIVGEASFFLTGPNVRSETVAQEDLINDTARRISELVLEAW